MCGVLHFGSNNLCVQRLACRTISASAELFPCYSLSQLMFVLLLLFSGRNVRETATAHTVTSCSCFLRSQILVFVLVVVVSGDVHVTRSRTYAIHLPRCNAASTYFYKTIIKLIMTHLSLIPQEQFPCSILVTRPTAQFPPNMLATHTRRPLPCATKMLQGNCCR